MGIDQWKHKYLYPFGNIAPIDPQKSIETATTQDSSRMYPDQSIFSTQTGHDKSKFEPAYNDIQRPQDSIFQSEESKFLNPNMQ